MSMQAYYLIVAAILCVLIPFVPWLLRIRIAFFKKIHWTRLANLHERHFGGFVMAIRIFMLAIAILLVVLAFGG